MEGCVEDTSITQTCSKGLYKDPTTNGCLPCSSTCNKCIYDANLG